MLHRPFRDEQQLLDGCGTFTKSYTSYLRTGNVPPCLQDDIHWLEQAEWTRDDGSDDSEEREDESLSLGYCPKSGIYRNLDTWGMLYIITEGAARGDYSTSRMVSKLWGNIWLRLWLHYGFGQWTSVAFLAGIYWVLNTSLNSKNQSILCIP